MTKKRVILIVLALLLACVVGVLLVKDSKYKFLFSSPRVSHETLVSAEKTRGLVVIDVPKAKSLIERKFKAPGWALPMTLPYEAALVIDVDRFLGDVGMKLFINDKRLAPVILQFADRLRLPTPFDQWFKDPMRQERRGVLVREGMTMCSRDMRTAIETQWKSAEVGEPLRVEGGHFIEVVLDNRDGSALAIASVFSESQGKPLAVDEMVLGFLGGISDYRLQADWVSDNELAVKLLVECSEEGLSGLLQMMLGGGLSDAQFRENAKRLGVTYQGSVTSEGNTVVADYKVNIEQLLARM